MQFFFKNTLNLQALLQFFYHTYRQFMHDRCLQRASALAYASLLAIVPLVVLAFSIFASFQGFDNLAQRIQGYLVSYLVPTSQHMVLNYLSSLAGKSTSLSIFGVLGLLITVTALLTTMEEAFNDIWRLPTKRTHLARFLTFWSLLTLSPLLLGISISITSYFAALPAIHHIVGSTSSFQHIPFLIPWLISSLGMTILYISLPNTSVHLRHAMVAGLIAGALFEVSKLGFTFYVTELANYEKLYGTLGTLPIFLLWIYVAWVIILIGAEMNVYLQHPQSINHPSATNAQKLIYFHYVLYRAAQVFQSGNSIQLDDIAHDLKLYPSDLHPYFHTLQEQHFLQKVSQKNDSSSHWTLGMDAQKITWQMIHTLVYKEDFQWLDKSKLPWHLPLKNTYQNFSEQQRTQLSTIKLADFIENT